MALKVIQTPKAPAAIGSYSQAVRAGGLLFCSGQIALDPLTGEMIDGGIEEQTERVLNNLGAVLEAGGATWDSVVRTTIYLVRMDEFTACNRIYASVLGRARPARVTVAVANLPKDALVEIEAVALCD